MNQFFLISYGLLWAIVLLTLVAVFMLYTHVGAEFLNSPAGRERQGPSVGRRLSPTALTELTGGSVTIGLPADVPRLVVFTSVRCRSCKTLLPLLGAYAQSLAGQLDVIVVCQGTPAEVKASTIAVAHLFPILIDERGSAATSYGLTVTPFVVALDRKGIVRRKGIPKPDLESINDFVFNSDIMSPALLRAESSGDATAESAGQFSSNSGRPHHPLASGDVH